jgi:hypothetical protein
MRGGGELRMIMGLFAKLAKHKKEVSDARARSLAEESAEDRRLRILRQKMRVRPERPAADKPRAEKPRATG